MASQRLFYVQLLLEMRNLGRVVNRLFVMLIYLTGVFVLFKVGINYIGGLNKIFLLD